MPKFGQKWPKMPQNATKSNLLGLYPKFLLPSFVDNQKSPFCVDDVAQFASGRPQMLKKINFWGASSLFKVFGSFMCGHPILFMAGIWSGRTPFFSSKKHSQGAERALLLWSKWGLRDGRRLVPSQLTYQIYFLLESVPILVPRRMMRIMQLSVENLPFQLYTSFNPGAHGLICECGGGRVGPAVGFEHKHWGAGRHLQPGQCCVPE